MSNYPIVPLTEKPVPECVRFTGVELHCVRGVGSMVLREFLQDVPDDIAACLDVATLQLWLVRSGLVFAMAELARQSGPDGVNEEECRYTLPLHAWSALRMVIRIGANEMAAGVLEEGSAAGQQQLIFATQVLRGIAAKLGDPLDEGTAFAVGAVGQA